MSAGGEPITSCPVCRYNLTGLPKNHRCPECGFEYDETMRVWRPRAIPFLAIWILWLALLPPIITYLPELHAKPTANLHDCRQTVFFIMGFATAIALTAVRGLVVLTRSGLTYRIPLGRTKFVAWTDLRVTESSLRLYRIGDGAMKRVNLPTGGLRLRESQAFRELIRQRWIVETSERC